MVSSAGEVRIGDLGLARLFNKPLQNLFNGDKVVVTIWYRAPELLLGSRHYTPAIDMWAVGCIFAELLALRPIFKGEEAKMDSKKTVPFQRHQMQKIVDIMGMPTKDKWPLLTSMSEYPNLNQLSNSSSQGRQRLESWLNATMPPSSGTSPARLHLGSRGLDLMAGLLEYNPEKRLTAQQALLHPFFSNGDKVSANCFEGNDKKYPARKVTNEENDMKSAPGTKRSVLPDDSVMNRPSKRIRTDFQ